MLPWVEAPSFSLDWSLPPDQRYASFPGKVAERGRMLLEELRAAVPRGVRYIGDLVRLRTAGRFHNEAVALAEMLGEDWRIVLAGNLAYDLAIASYGCSTIALATRSGPVLARNMDWSPERPLAQASCLVRAEARGQLLFANAGWPGAIGVVSGLSGRGFGVVLNAVPTPSGIDKLGYPVLLHIRRVLEDAEDFDDAVQRLENERLSVGCLLTVVGRDNQQRVVIERTPREHLIRRPEGDRPIVCTNHYRELYEKVSGGDVDPGELLCGRYDTLLGCFDETASDVEVSDARLLYALTDEQVLQNITAQHVIMRPRDNRVCLWVPRRLLNADGFS